MFTIKFQDGNNFFETTRETIDRAQRYAKNWMHYWKSTEVYYTNCPELIIFQASQFEVTKETL